MVAAFLLIFAQERPSRLQMTVLLVLVVLTHENVDHVDYACSDWPQVPWWALHLLTRIVHQLHYEQLLVLQYLVETAEQRVP